MKVALIWAMDEERVIGSDNGLPWKLPADMRWFRRHTLAKPVVMGRNTFESFGGSPLPERQNIVVSRNPDYQARGALVVSSPGAALVAAGPAEEVMVIGGEALYREMLPRASRLYMTRVYGRFEGDTWFPEFDESEWREVERHEFAADTENPWPYSFHILDREGAP